MPPKVSISPQRKRAATAASQQQTTAAVKRNKRIKADPDAATSVTAAAAGGGSAAAASSAATSLTTEQQLSNLKTRFLAIFQEPEFANNNSDGVSNDVLKQRFSDEDYLRLPPIINQLMGESRLAMSQGSSSSTSGGGSSGSASTTKQLFYNLVSDEVASKFAGLDASAKMMYQVIEQAGNMGIWTKDIKKETNIQNQAMNKILKTLEGRRLIKRVNSVTAKNKKLYMLYDLTPSTELTGGVWYSDLELDSEFISKLRTFLMHCVRRLNHGQGCTLPEILEKVQQAKVSRVPLSLDNVRQLMQTLIFDHLVLEKDNTKSSSSQEDVVEICVSDGTQVVNHNAVVYVAARRVTSMCEFKWWADALSPDFQYREIQFEDGVHLAAHEPNYQTA